MKIVIKNVNDTNKYTGAYAKIFSILNSDRIFSEVYELDSSVGLVNDTYYLTISETPDFDKVEKIKKLKNVTVL